jgi:hypothetical protein
VREDQRDTQALGKVPVIVVVGHQLATVDLIETTERAADRATSPLPPGGNGPVGAARDLVLSTVALDVADKSSL